MTITYVTNGPWGTGSGAGAGGVATVSQIDNNFFDIDSRLQQVESAIADGMTFADPPITFTSGSITFHLTDGSAITDFVVPLPAVTYTGRGVWQPSTLYSEFDIIFVTGVGAYLVLEEHTSGSTFDPDAGDSDPHYALLFPLSETEAAVASEVTGTTRTLSLDDVGLYLRFTNASGCAVTVPNNSSVAIPVDSEIHIRQAAAGEVSFVAASGVTLNPQRDGYGTATPWLGATITLKKVSSNTWDIIGPHGPSEESV